jgi:paraquat-inducible protein B
MNASLPTPPLPEPVQRRWHGPSLIWLVPIAALLVGLVLLIRSLLTTGPLITIDFESADGLKPGQTEVRFKEVVVGKVESIALTKKHTRVRASVRLNQSAAHLAVEDTQFWVIKPRVDLSGVSGLETLVSGAYIGVDAGTSNENQSEFLGLKTPPYFLRGEPGRVFVLHTQDLGSLSVGSPGFIPAHQSRPSGRL